MENSFSVFEVRLIRSLYTKKSDEDIALVLEKPTVLVSEKIKEMTGGISPFHSEQRERIKQGERKAEVTRQKKQEKKSKEQVENKRSKSSRIIASQNAEMERKRKLREQPQYKTKEVILSNLIAVRIDQRTTIFIKPGEDPMQAKLKYFDRLREKQKVLFPQPDPEKWKKVSKFK
jgi:hypothetical protein